jgi:Concanavalin A-like lectin/glucanases superfamily
VYLWAYAAMDEDVPLPYHLELTASWFSHDTSEEIQLVQLLRGARWRHVTLTWSVTDQARIYVDGKLEITVKLAGASHPLISGGLLVVGQSTVGYDGISSPFYDSDSSLGQIDNFRVFDGVLSPSQVHDVMYMAKDGVTEVLTGPLLVWLTFDDDQVHSVLHHDNTTRVEAVHDAASNVTAYGGCLGCFDISFCPLLAISDCPVITSSVVPARYSPRWSSTQAVVIPVLLRLLAACTGVGSVKFSDEVAVLPAWNESVVVIGEARMIRQLNSVVGMCEVLGGAVIALPLAEMTSTRNPVISVTSLDSSMVALEVKTVTSGSSTIQHDVTALAKPRSFTSTTPIFGTTGDS